MTLGNEKSHKEWLEDADLELANTERKLLSEGLNAPIELPEQQSYEGGEPLSEATKNYRMRTQTWKRLRLEDRFRDGASVLETLAYSGRKVGNPALGFLTFFMLRALFFCLAVVLV